MAQTKTSKRKLGRIAKSMTKLLKDEIKRQDLVDTGRMLRETATKIKFNDNDCSFKLSVRSTTYFKYVNGNFNITKNVFASADWLTLTIQLRKLVGECHLNRAIK